MKQLRDTNKVLYCLIVLFAFPFFAAAHLRHTCDKETCPICRTLEKGRQILSILSRLFGIGNKLAAGTNSYGYIHSAPLTVRPFTLVTLRVKLSD